MPGRWLAYCTILRAASLRRMKRWAMLWKPCASSMANLASLTAVLKGAGGGVGGAKPGAESPANILCKNIKDFTKQTDPTWGFIVDLR